MLLIYYVITMTCRLSICQLALDFCVEYFVVSVSDNEGDSIAPLQLM